jgi:glycosyltransferase involved in cell wall biosynthesis
MDIVVKSFNRPFYLDRCLRSIYQYVRGDFQIRILDDGTPPRYLTKIQEKYPEVIIIRSPYYDAKVQALAAHVAGTSSFNQKIIPIGFWMDGIAQATERFLLLEDDIWLVKEMDMSAIEQVMISDQLDMVKLFWYSNPRLNSGKAIARGAGVEEIIPKIPLATRTIFLNDFKVRSILYRLGFFRFYNDFELWLPLYTFHSMASVFFRRDYWLSLWTRDQVKLNEANPLRAAVKYHRTHGSRVAKTTEEYTRDSHTSSATNIYADVRLDPFVLSNILSEAWLNEQFDSYTDFPADFSPAAIKPLLDSAADERASYREWLRWAERRKAQYQVLGCQVD